MKWPMLTEEERISRLTPKEGVLDMVLDTDTYNEVDDQFALCYALKSPERLRVEAVYAAPYLNDRSTSAGDGMQRSYDEIVRLMRFMDMPTEGIVFPGSDRFLKSADAPVKSAAAEDLIARAMSRPEDDPLYVAAIGAITNVASALIMEPRLVRHIVVVWLGGNPLHWPHTREFNLIQDVPSARVILDSAVPFVMIPCMGVASHLLTSVPEINAHLKGKNPVCDALAELFASYSDDHFGWGKEIWDISTIGYLINPEWVPTELTHAPHLSDDGRFSVDTGRHLMRMARFVHRNGIFRDMFAKLTK